MAGWSIPELNGVFFLMRKSSKSTVDFPAMLDCRKVCNEDLVFDHQTKGIEVANTDWESLGDVIDKKRGIWLRTMSLEHDQLRGLKWVNSVHLAGRMDFTDKDGDFIHISYLTGQNCGFRLEMGIGYKWDNSHQFASPCNKWGWSWRMIATSAWSNANPEFVGDIYRFCLFFKG